VRHYAVQLDVAAAKDASELYRPRADARDSQKRVDPNPSLGSVGFVDSDGQWLPLLGAIA
jgi:hypothetical protein